MLSVTADDDRTLTVTLDTAYENFSLMLDVPIVSAATVQSSTPLGTGPYYLDGEVLRRSSRWWQTQAPAVTAETSSCRRPKRRTTSATISNSAARTLCTATRIPRQPSATAAIMRRGKRRRPSCTMSASTSTAAGSRWSLLRRAFTYGVDREAMTSAVYNGLAQAATLPCSPASDLYDAQLAAQYAYSGHGLS